MTLPTYLKTMSSLTVVCWVAWIYLLFAINPEATSWIGFLLFYVSLFLSLVGTAAIIGFLIRFVGLKQLLAFRSVKEAFRQSFLFAILIVASLLLLSQDLFTWLNLMFLIIGLSILEFFLLSYGKP
ncbi:MAG: hypothetical protein Q7T50_02620 [Candidatus Magasanikbacteria bacterium]|nr:hypothetical protein [Candidatus Magasanikbacteria bacterium]